MEIKIDRKQLYDPYRGEFVYDIVPTLSIKRSRMVPGGAGTYANLASYSIGPGSVGLLTFLSLGNVPGTRTAGGPFAIMRLRDRNGTVETIVQNGGTNMSGGSRDYLQRGHRLAPIHTVYGTFSLSKSNAVLMGTIIASWEMVTVSGVPGREGTVTHV